MPEHDLIQDLREEIEDLRRELRDADLSADRKASEARKQGMVAALRDLTAHIHLTSAAGTEPTADNLVETMNRWADDGYPTGLYNHQRQLTGPAPAHPDFRTIMNLFPDGVFFAHAENIALAVADWLEGHDRQVRADESAEIVALLKASPAVLLAGKGGAYELLQRREENR